MGNKYFWKLEQMGERLVLCDIDPTKGKDGHPFYCHFGEVVEPLKAVIVAVNPQEHVSIAEKFLRDGLPVLLEKPPALSLEEFERISHYRNLYISEVEGYSVCAEFLRKPRESLRIERLGRAKGYISPLWDLAWHDLYLMQRVCEDVRLESLKVEGNLCILEGYADGVPFSLSVAWEHPQPRRRWYIDGELILDFGEERVYKKGELLREEKRDKLRLMVESFLKGSYDRKSVERARGNLLLLEKLSHTSPF